VVNETSDCSTAGVTGETSIHEKARLTAAPMILCHSLDFPSIRAMTAPVNTVPIVPGALPPGPMSPESLIVRTNSETETD
jgi:hypothetical protein